MIDECKVTSTFKPSQPNNESRLREEIDRLRQRQLLRDDEIKDLRNKNLKLELEIKEKAQRERNVSIPDLNRGELLDYLFWVRTLKARAYKGIYIIHMLHVICICFG